MGAENILKNVLFGEKDRELLLETITPIIKDIVKRNANGRFNNGDIVKVQLGTELLFKDGELITGRELEKMREEDNRVKEKEPKGFLGWLLGSTARGKA
jgi:PBP1b-binding outer membrane lipoprotein LpoB